MGHRAWAGRTLSGDAARALVAASPSQFTMPAMTPPRSRPSLSSSSRSASMLLYVEGSRRCRSDALHTTQLVRRQQQRCGATAAAGGGGRAAQPFNLNLHSSTRSCDVDSRPRAAGWPAHAGLLLSEGREAARLHRDMT